MPLKPRRDRFAMSRAEQAAAMSRLLLMVQDKEQNTGSVGKRVLFEMWLQMKTSPRGPSKFSLVIQGKS